MQSHPALLFITVMNLHQRFGTTCSSKHRSDLHRGFLQQVDKVLADANGRAGECVAVNINDLADLAIGEADLTTDVGLRNVTEERTDVARIKLLQAFIFHDGDRLERR